MGIPGIIAALLGAGLIGAWYVYRALVGLSIPVVLFLIAYKLVT